MSLLVSGMGIRTQNGLSGMGERARSWGTYFCLACDENGGVRQMGVELSRKEDEEEVSHIFGIPWLLFRFRWMSLFHARNVGNSGCNIISSSLQNSTTKRTPYHSGQQIH